MSVGSASNGNLEMNIMWAIMGVMLICDATMIYIHLKLHKKVEILEKELIKRQ